MKLCNLRFDDLLFIFDLAIEISLISPPKSYPLPLPWGSARGRRTDLSPLSPLLSPLGSAKGTKSESIPLNPPTGEEGDDGEGLEVGPGGAGRGSFQS